MTNNVFELLSFDDPQTEMQKSVLIASMLNHLRTTRTSLPKASARLGIPFDELVHVLACAHEDMTVAQIQGYADAILSLKKRRLGALLAPKEHWRKPL